MSEDDIAICTCTRCGGGGMVLVETPTDDGPIVFARICAWCHGTGLGPHPMDAKDTEYMSVADDPNEST